VSFIDEANRYSELHLLQTRTAQEIVTFFQTQTGRKVKEMCSDNVGEYMNKELDKLL
jgi:hypothetical protein